VDAITGLDHYALWHATRGVLLRRMGRLDEARAAEARAAALPMNDPQRSFVEGSRDAPGA
jgi:RNA polymerase sigma-70 factor (ECF subfamily)